MNSLTLAYITSRTEPHIEWFLDSLHRQGEQDYKIIVVNSNLEHSYEVSSKLYDGTFIDFWNVPPKPTIWQGKYRITRDQWWAKSNAHNTAICLCQTEFIAFVDDRCVLTPIWLQCVREAMAGNYAVCGSYEKRAHMKVENGEIIDQGELLGLDTRTPGLYPFDSWYGGSCALSLEWCLQVQGYPEICDGASGEDSMFGILLRNNGFPVRYDSRMRIIEDRTPGEIDGALKRADKNPHLGQRAKSWDIVRMFQNQTTSQNQFDIRNMRDRVLLNGESLKDMLPVGSHFDFYDGQPISEMK